MDYKRHCTLLYKYVFLDIFIFSLVFCIFNLIILFTQFIPLLLRAWLAIYYSVSDIQCTLME